ncbi:MAG: tetratricopeptide repeat protein, partial [Gemmatimonadaceae bacterium]
MGGTTQRIMMQGSTRIDELRQKFHENPRRYFAPLANEYRKGGDPEQAIAICRAHLAQQPGHMSGHVVYGQALYDANRTEEARHAFERAVALDPDNAIVLRYLGDIARTGGETREARHWYSRALDADPHDGLAAAYISEMSEPESPSAAADDAAETPIAADIGLDTPTGNTGAAQTTEAEETPPVSAGQPASVEIELEPVLAIDAAEDEVVAVEEFADVGATGEVDQVPAVDEAEETVAAGAIDEVVAAEPAPTMPPETTDIPWRKTPASPFVTRTMAELYARQGYTESALDVYRKLAATNPADEEIRARIVELGGGEKETSDTTVPAVEDEGPKVPAVLTDEELVDDPLALEPAAHAEREDASDSPVHADNAFDPFDFAVADDGAAGSPAEFDDTDLISEAGAGEGRHFTEMEIQTEGSWGADTWGADLSGTGDVDIELDALAAPMPEEGRLDQSVIAELESQLSSVGIAGGDSLRNTDIGMADDEESGETPRAA